MKHIIEQDWEHLGHEFRHSDPFPSICIDGFLDAQFARELAKSYPSFEEAQSVGMEFRTVNEKRKVQITDPDHFPDPVIDLQKDLASAEFLQAMEKLSGITDLRFDPNFDGGGMHLTSQSGILDVHVDFNRSHKLALFRRLNLLIYLNEEWDEAWGGNIELWNRDVTRCVKSFTPDLGRCLIFATSDISFHGVTAVNCPAGKSRNSFAIYLYNDRPGTVMQQDSHGTIFKARPSEKAKKYFTMPAEACVQWSSERIRRGKKILKGLIRKG